MDTHTQYIHALSVYIHTLTHIRKLCVCIYMHTQAHTVYIHTHTYTHEYIHTHAHTMYICTYTRTAKTCKHTLYTHISIHKYIHNSGDFPGGSDGKESACNKGDLGSIPGLGRSPGEGSGCPLQYSCLENPMDRGA